MEKDSCTDSNSPTDCWKNSNVQDSFIQNIVDFSLSVNKRELALICPILIDSNHLKLIHLIKY
jgi:hypothetical protein